MLAFAIMIVLANFSLAMFFVAAVFSLFHRLVMKRKISEYEILYRWMAFFALGIAGLYSFFMHLCYPILTASNIGWISSPFQYEVAMANLAIGVLGVFSFKASYGFRLATVLASLCWLWGDAAVHIYQIIFYHNFTVGNAGSWLWMDILIPLILLICIIKLKPTAYQRHD